MRRAASRRSSASRSSVKADDGIVVPQGARHNVVSTGSEPLRLYTIYGPPEHIDGTVHKETILHDAGAKSPRALSEDNIIRIIKEAGRIPAACDCNFNILRIIE